MSLDSKQTDQNLITENALSSIHPVDFKKKSDIHLARKIWHVLGCLSLFLGFSILSIGWFKLLIVLLMILFVSLDLLRKKISGLNVFLVKYLKPIMRDSEISKLAGTTYLIVGVAFIVFIFSAEVVSLSLLFLAFADPVASFFGVKFGRDKILGDKTVQGFLAAFVVCTLIAVIYFFVKDFPISRLLIVSVLCGFLGACAELVPIGKLDDNLTLPIISAVGLSLLFYIFGFFN